MSHNKCFTQNNINVAIPSLGCHTRSSNTSSGSPTFTTVSSETTTWHSEPHTAFTKMKQLFFSAPILIHPNTNKQFIVEVDASDMGVGAVLSQRSGSQGKLQLCAFFSCRQSPSERNCDVGDKKLLAIKVALEEWRHWLEGSEQPFLIWTDHKKRNLF